MRGFWHAHMGWLFERELTNAVRFAPDLLADRDIRRVDRLFPLLTAAQLLVLMNERQPRRLREHRTAALAARRTVRSRCLGLARRPSRELLAGGEPESLYTDR